MISTSEETKQPLSKTKMRLIPFQVWSPNTANALTDAPARILLASLADSMHSKDGAKRVQATYYNQKKNKNTWRVIIIASEYATKIRMFSNQCNECNKNNLLKKNIILFTVITSNTI